jgi:hypothetical protein
LLPFIELRCANVLDSPTITTKCSAKRRGLDIRVVGDVTQQVYVDAARRSARTGRTKACRCL